MPEVRVRLDPLNPGHFFACCGLFELFAAEQQNAIAWFETDNQHPRRAFFLLQHSEASLGLDERLDRLGKAQLQYPDEEIEPALRPVRLGCKANGLTLDWWLNEFRDKAVLLKCWAGQVTTKNLFSELLPLIGTTGGEDLFYCARMTKAKFGVDPRSAWNTLDFGFSPNEHGRDSAVFPAVEILAAVGLQTFRPNITSREDIRYSLWKAPLTVAVARQAFRNPWDGLPKRPCAFAIQQRGQSYKYFTFARDSQQERESA